MEQRNIYLKQNFLLFIYLFFHFFREIIASNEYCQTCCKVVDKKCVQIEGQPPYCEPTCLPDLVSNKCYECTTATIKSYYHIESGECKKGCIANGKVIFGSTLRKASGKVKTNKYLIKGLQKVARCQHH